MELTINLEKPKFNTCPINTKLCVMVEFPNCISTTIGESFKWMPTYAQLEQIKAALDKIEDISWKGGKKNASGFKTKSRTDA